MRALLLVVASVAAEPLVLNRSETPALFIPGIDKGGTSDAYLEILKAEPTFVESAKGKEVGCLYQRDAAACYRAAFCDGPGGACAPSIDATPNYMWSFAVDAAAAAAAAAPTAASIFFLRHPVKRIKSLHNYWKAGDARIGALLGATVDAHVGLELEYLAAESGALGKVLDPEASTFRDYERLCRGFGPWIGRERPGRCKDVTGPTQGVEANTSEPCPVHIPFVATSLYAPMLRRWVGAFTDPAATTVVLESEAYFRDPRVLLDLFPGAGLSEAALEATRLAARRRLHANAAVYRTPPLSPRLDADLHGFFQKPTEDLRDLLRSMPPSRVAPEPGSWWAPPR